MKQRVFRYYPTCGTKLQKRGMTAAGIINSNIFIIDNDKATTSCDYFKLWTKTDTAANCSASPQVLGTDSQISSGKDFWVYVK